ncbi:hypothetical protein SAMN05216266_11270 [Amycolatopsis marina]|uniref:Uncharacterized protein n=1 Tax=Amycolatopsis marina TaxID=490629 RepID=A0A1I1B7E5_9PSEU|nr:hypothetical protein [Amycolatopsis marina]SFB45586.1 hypothetical protein SAMN05216266_11270 [Amycolatopsis marina]
MSLLEEARWLPGIGALRAELPTGMGGPQYGPETLAVRALTGEAPRAAEPGSTVPQPRPRTIRHLSGDRLRAVPVRGPWTAEAVYELLGTLMRLSAVVPIATVDTGSFAAPDTPQRALRDFLDTGLPPLWMSAHRAAEVVFVGGLVYGRRAALACVLDTAPVGDAADGHRVHLQPLPHLAAALHDAGMLLVVPAAEAADAGRIVTQAGLRT